jgi:hypothetical protein
MACLLLSGETRQRESPFSMVGFLTGQYSMEIRGGQQPLNGAKPPPGMTIYASAFRA